MRPKVLVLPKAVGPRVAQAINSNAEALDDTIKQVRILTGILARGFFGRCKWLLFGR